MAYHDLAFSHVSDKDGALLFRRGNTSTGRKGELLFKSYHFYRRFTQALVITGDIGGYSDEFDALEDRGWTKVSEGSFTRQDWVMDGSVAHYVGLGFEISNPQDYGPFIGYCDGTIYGSSFDLGDWSLGGVKASLSTDSHVYVDDTKWQDRQRIVFGNDDPPLSVCYSASVSGSSDPDWDTHLEFTYTFSQIDLPHHPECPHQ